MEWKPSSEHEAMDKRLLESEPEFWQIGKHERDLLRERKIKEEKNMRNVYTWYDTQKRGIGHLRDNTTSISRSRFNQLYRNRVYGGDAGIYCDGQDGEYIDVVDKNGNVVNSLVCM